MSDIDNERLRRLLDKEDIRETFLKYTRGIDRHDDDLAAEAYHDDANDDHGTFIGSPRDLFKHAKALHKSLWVGHHHYVTNQTIDLDGDVAHVETYLMVAAKRSDGTIDLSGGRYVDRFDRRDGRWAITERICMPEWGGELVRQDFSIGDLFIQGSWDRGDPSYQRPLRVTRPARDMSLEELGQNIG
jgi:hypothetical protein